MSFEKGSYNHDGVAGGEILYFISPFHCGDKSETHTVREWLTDFNLPVEDRYFLSWHAFISEVCLFIRKQLNEIVGEDVARHIRILYGGSVKDTNAAQFCINGIDGVLVGGASLKVESFAKIVRSF